MTNLSSDFKTIAIVGIGSLGGFIANELSLLNNIKKITLIDFDIVEQDNLSNSIYDKYDIGKLKTVALYNKLLLRGKHIDYITDQYVGDNIKFPDYDLVIDCRDISSVEDKNLSFKTYISNNILIVDCKSHTEKNEYILDGRYSYELEKWKIPWAARKICTLIESNYITLMMEQKLIISFDSEYIKKLIYDEIECLYNKKEIIEDYTLLHENILNISEMSQYIIEENKTKKIKFEFAENDFRKLIPKKSINQTSDLIPILKPIISSKFNKNNYILNHKLEKNNNETITIIIVSKNGGS